MKRAVKSVRMGRKFWICTWPFEDAVVPTYEFRFSARTSAKFRSGAWIFHGVPWSS